MHAQVFHLQQAGVACGYLSSGQDYEESRALLARLQRHNGGDELRILFVTPEKVARSDYLMRVLDGLYARQLLVRAAMKCHSTHGALFGASETGSHAQCNV